jgi:putative GTP pyrophosphokinase
MLAVVTDDPVTLSKSQIDRLGDRLRQQTPTEVDLRLLHQYRRSFGDAYESVVATIRQEIGLEPTGRPAKSTPSIIEKLLRERVRLSQVQDIAGCRVVVHDIPAQERALKQLLNVFPRATIVDRRQQSSHGYRAVHLIVRLGARPIEIQLRTTLEHRWAELSEKLSDVWEHDIKYGGGRPPIRRALDETSQSVQRIEQRETKLHEFNDAVREGRAQLLRDLSPEEVQSAETSALSIATELAKARQELFAMFDRLLAIFTKAH